jgi:hypothetical protein
MDVDCSWIEDEHNEKLRELGNASGQPTNPPSQANPLAHRPCVRLFNARSGSDMAHKMICASGQNGVRSRQNGVRDLRKWCAQLAKWCAPHFENNGCPWENGVRVDVRVGVRVDVR